MITPTEEEISELEIVIQ